MAPPEFVPCHAKGATFGVSSLCDNNGLLHNNFLELVGRRMLLVLQTEEPHSGGTHADPKRQGHCGG